MTPMTLAIERVLAFHGLDVLVAGDAGLFAAQGPDVRIAMRPRAEIRSATDGTLSISLTNLGRLVDRGDAAMFRGRHCTLAR